MILCNKLSNWDEDIMQCLLCRFCCSTKQSSIMFALYLHWRRLPMQQSSLFSDVETWAPASLTSWLSVSFLSANPMMVTLWHRGLQVAQQYSFHIALSLRPKINVFWGSFNFINANTLTGTFKYVNTVCLKVLEHIFKKKKKSHWDQRRIWDSLTMTDKLWLSLFLHRAGESGKHRELSSGSNCCLRSDGMGCVEGGPEQLAAFSITNKPQAQQRQVGENRKWDNPAFKTQHQLLSK